MATVWLFFAPEDRDKERIEKAEFLGEVDSASTLFDLIDRFEYDPDMIRVEIGSDLVDCDQAMQTLYAG